MSKPIILIVDDEPSILLGYSRYLKKSGYEVREADSISSARKALELERFDAAILDMVLPDGSGIDLLSYIKKKEPGTSVIFITGRGDVPLAVQAMSLGADNFLQKPVNLSDVDVFLKKSIEVSTLRRKEIGRQRLATRTIRYFGESPAIKKVMELATVAAENDSPILLQGETGSGKGFLASWIHEHSERKDASYVELNCSSLRGELLASELFGHVRGAFTSADRDRQGLLDVAGGGTLFLDEIGDMHASVQSQFLKVIEDKSYRRLGESTMRKSDFRLICASNKDLQKAVSDGEFRGDLYYRIIVFPIEIPPLRQRNEDIPGLIRSITEALGRADTEISKSAMEVLRVYPWPGNIRELKNVIERATMLSRGSEVRPEHLPGLSKYKSAPMDKGSVGNLREAEEKHIENIISKHGGDVMKAAAELGLSRSTLYRKLQQIRNKQ